MLEDLQNPAIPLTNDSGLRARIVERYLHFEGRRYEHQLHDMLPRSGSTVFTQADIAPRNIMIDEQNSVTGVLAGNLRGGIRITGSMCRFRDLLSGVTGRCGWIGLRRGDGILVELMPPGGSCFKPYLLVDW